MNDSILVTPRLGQTFRRQYFLILFLGRRDDLYLKYVI